MADWSSELKARLARLNLPADREAEIVSELSQHLEDRETELRRNGVPADEAHRLALDEVSDDERMREELARLARRARPLSHLPPPGAPGGGALEQLWRDARYGVRALLSARGFLTASVLALALGIGATTAIFAAVDAVLLRPMPFPNADRLFVPVSVNLAKDIHQGSIPYADYDEWRQATDLFAAVALWSPGAVDITGDGDPERVQIAQVSEEYFKVIETTPLHGRTFAAADHVVGAPRVVVISHGLWQRRFGGAEGVVGRPLRVSGNPYQVIGILSKDAVWPDDAQLFFPMRPAGFGEDVRTRRDNMIFLSLARLRDDVTLAAANARLGAIAARVAQDHPESRAGWTSQLLPLREFIVEGDLATGLYVLLGAVGAVLLIACANVANLSLVRGSGRARELALRLSLGASRRRLLQQLIVEGVVLTTISAVVGAAIAAIVIKGLTLMAPEGTPFVDRIAMHPRVFLAMLVVSGIAALVATVVPAVSISAVHVSGVLREGGGAGVSRRAARLRHLLVVGETAAAVVLLTGGALFLRSFDRLSHVDAGVDLDRVISARLSIPSSRYQDAAKRSKFVADLAAAVESDPGVERAAVTSFVPAGAGGFGLGRVFLAEGRPEPPAGSEVGAQWNVITPHYFETVGIRLLAGRAFNDHDTTDTVPVIIVTESFAQKMFPGESALGRRVRSWRDENKLREIVGVVSDVKYGGLADRDRSLVYVPYPQDSWGAVLLVARTRYGDPETLAPALRKAVKALDPNLALAEVRSLAASARRSIAAQRYATLVLSTLAGVALVLAALGIYGVTSYVFTLRRREMGIRLALGASRASLYGLVLKHGLLMTALGLVIGIAGAIATTRVIANLLFKTSASDPFAWSAMAIVLLLSAVLACLIPARRAAHEDPVQALRAE